MYTAQIDIKCKITAYPYVAPIVSTTTASSGTGGTAISDNTLTDIENILNQIPNSVPDQGTPGEALVGTDEWRESSISDLSFMEKITKGIEKPLNILDKIVTIIEKILRIMEFFISGFSSFSKLISSAIDMAQRKLDKYSDSTLGMGVYANVIAPPAFLRGSSGDVDAANQSRGGFEGFLGRLDNSLYNTKDINRPTYTENDYVGGMVILLDTELIDDAWQGIKQLSSIFGFMYKFGINLSPPPPSNLRGFCGQFPYQDLIETLRFGIQLEWDNNYVSSAYNVYRSRIPGGTTKLVEYVPNTLMDNPETGEPGLIPIAGNLIANIFRRVNHPSVYPEREEKVYGDPTFNGGSPVLVKAGIGPTVSYIDRDMRLETINGIQVPVIEENGKLIPIINYYYIIKSCDDVGKNEGTSSNELVVAIKPCNDSYNIASVIPHPTGRFEFLSAGYGKVNSWSSVQLKLMIPWLVEIIDMMNQFLNSLKGMTTSTSESFTEFINQIKAKVKMYIDILKVISWVVLRFKDFMFSPSVAFLSLPPSKGGMDIFSKRIRSARLPDGDSFSGSNGVTIGIVLAYGGATSASIKAIQKSFETILALFTKK